jgi:hypothetical protein
MGPMLAMNMETSVAEDGPAVSAKRLAGKRESEFNHHSPDSWLFLQDFSFFFTTDSVRTGRCYVRLGRRVFSAPVYFF